MTLKDRIKDDMKTAFKAGDTATRGALSFLFSVIQNRELDKRARLVKGGQVAESEAAEQSALTDDEVVDAISSELKKRKDAIVQYEAAGRAELAKGEQAEADILMRYMPEQMSEEQVMGLITDAIAATGASGPKDTGKVMGQVTAKTKGKFDGSRVSELVKKALGLPAQAGA